MAGPGDFRKARVRDRLAHVFVAYDDGSRDRREHHHKHSIQAGDHMAGPLAGLKVVEAGGIGPAPFCAMVLADLGAQVVQVTRLKAVQSPFDIPGRGRQRVALDLRSPEGRDAALALASHADILIEGFRPGVMERLGLGPDVCMKHNPRLIYGRMTGWGQTGPLAAAAGHDINYLALSGALHAIGRPDEPPIPPLNLVGDYGGGAMLMAVGVLSALHERSVSGMGQVIDAAMSDGAALLSSLFYGMTAAGTWSAGRGENHLDGGAHFYNTYRCADGKYLSVAASEEKFYAQLIKLCDIEDPLFAGQWDRSRWPMLKARLADMFLLRSRDEWCAMAAGLDVCIAPVLDWSEAPAHAHNRARSTFVSVDGVTQPAPAPRFSRTPAAMPQPSVAATDEVLGQWGVAQELIDAARAAVPG